jgi:hypothetical protein
MVRISLNRLKTYLEGDVGFRRDQRHDGQLYALFIEESRKADGLAGHYLGGSSFQKWSSLTPDSGGDGDCVDGDKLPGGIGRSSSSSSQHREALLGKQEEQHFRPPLRANQPTRVRDGRKWPGTA